MTETDPSKGESPEYTVSEAEAAMCLWEEVLAALSSGKGLDWAFARQLTEGTVVLRSHILDLAKPCHEAWTIAHQEGKGFDEPFDWEFVPWFLRNAVDEDGDLKPDWKDLAMKMGDR